MKRKSEKNEEHIGASSELEALKINFNNCQEKADIS